MSPEGVLGHLKVLVPLLLWETEELHQTRIQSFVLVSDL